MMMTMNPSKNLFRVLNFLKDFVSDEYISVNEHTYNTSKYKDLKVKYFININYYINKENIEKIEKFIENIKNVYVEFHIVDEEDDHPIETTNSFNNIIIPTFNNPINMSFVSETTYTTITNTATTNEPIPIPVQPEIILSKYEDMVMVQKRKRKIFEDLTGVQRMNRPNSPIYAERFHYRNETPDRVQTYIFCVDMTNEQYESIQLNELITGYNIEMRCLTNILGTIIYKEYDNPNRRAKFLIRTQVTEEIIREHTTEGFGVSFQASSESYYNFTRYYIHEVGHTQVLRNNGRRYDELTGEVNVDDTTTTINVENYWFPPPIQETVPLVDEEPT